MARDHQKIRAWQLADDLAKRVYQITRSFPKTETFGLTSQMRRAAVSVPANIVEGAARRYRNEYIQFLYVAMGSLAELGYYLDLSEHLGYVGKADVEPLNELHDHTTRTLRALIRYIEEAKPASR